jgi:Putative prokaryotic signal transducing protein
MVDHSDPVVPLTEAADEMEAGIIIAALEDEGIQATMTGTATAEFRAGVPGEVQILVRHADLARAQQILEAVNEDQQDVDWSDVDVGEPEP